MGAAAFRRAGCRLVAVTRPPTSAALATCQGKIKRFGELASYAGFYFSEEVRIDPAAAAREFTPEARVRLKKLRDALAPLEDFTAAGLERTLKGVAAELGVKAGALVHPARLACTGAGRWAWSLSTAGNSGQRESPQAFGRAAQLIFAIDNAAIHWHNYDVSTKRIERTTEAHDNNWY